MGQLTKTGVIQDIKNQFTKVFNKLINKWRFRNWNLQSIKYYTFNSLNVTITNCDRCGQQYPLPQLIPTKITTQGYQGLSEVLGIHIFICEKCLKEITKIKK